MRWWWILIAILAAGAGFVLVRSLERLIQEPSDVEEIMQIAPGTALRTVQLFFGSPDHVGFIAEDVPNLVATKDREGLSPMDIVAVLTKVVQEQQKTMEEMRKDIAELKKSDN